MPARSAAHDRAPTSGTGKWTGGTRPYGYLVDRDHDRLTPHPTEAPIMREIFDLYVTARLGTRTAANQLNARGLRNRTAKAWSGHNIGRIPANRVYLGEVHFRDVVTDAHPALIDETIFNAAQRLRDARGDKQTQRAGSDSDYHCTGLITCPRCGHKYVGTSAHGNTRRYRYYSCFSRTRYGAAGCPAGRIDADDLDTAVLDAIANTFTSRTDLLIEVVARARRQHHDRHAHRRAELATVEAEITSARAAIDRYLTAFENGTPQRRHLRAAHRRPGSKDHPARRPPYHPRRPHQHRTHRTRSRRARRTAPPDPARHRLRTPAQRKELIEAMVAEIRIDGDTDYPIFVLRQDDETRADMTSTGAKGSPVRTMVRSVNRMWQDPNRIHAAQGSVVVVSVVRRRGS